tara:strand:- start:4075 stop:4386 length:312 start_codon:yes stop_codon:yes gene_type:complete
MKLKPKMTNSNIQPPDATNDQTVNIDSSNSYDPTMAGDVVITTGTAADTFTVDPDDDLIAGAIDFQVDNMTTSVVDNRLDHILEHLHSLESKIDSLHARLDAV